MKKAIAICIVSLLMSVLAYGVWAEEGNNLSFTKVYNEPLTSRMGGSSGDIRVEYMMVTDDTDGDGMPEIVCSPRLEWSGAQGAALEVYEATADNTYSLSWEWEGDSSIWYRSNVTAVADLDGNGHKEILMGVNSSVTDVLAVFENVGPNDWGTDPRRYTWTDLGATDPGVSMDFASLIWAGDIDNDGDDEVILCNTNVQDGMVIASVASGTFAADNVTWKLEFERNWESTDKGSPYAIAVGNIDNDTNTDIAVICWDNLRVDLYECTGADTYALVSSANLSASDDYSWYACEISDLDGDGNGELWILNIQDGGVYAAEISDLSTVTAGDFSVVFDSSFIGGGQINMDFGNQDHGTGSDGADLYLVGGVDDVVVDLEYNGGDPLNSANWTKYEINAWTGGYGDTLWMIEAPEVDLDGDTNKEIVFTRQDADGTRPGGFGNPKAAPSLFVLEWYEALAAHNWELYR
ncbi:VCBS repeat-containing protein [Candidatus Sumerlaeota bacterium]|nr:VCBS repeat-containing protein [Candidatus Sumerlaeota bacterium]